MNDPISKISLRSFGDVVDLVPYALGFDPADSLVVLLTDTRGRLVITARMDLDDARPPGNLEHLLDGMWRQVPDGSGIIVAYTSDRYDGWDLTHRAVAHQPAMIAQGLVDGDTWYTPDGDTGRFDRYSRVAAGATYAGLSKAASRDDLVAGLTPRPDSPDLDAHLTTIVAQLPRANQTADLATATTTVLNATLGASTLTDVDALTLAALAHHPAARDTALLTITRDNADDHARLWRMVVARSPESVAAPPLFLAGMAAWISGDGASANIAHDLAVTYTPDGMPTPVAILATLNATVTPPTAWDELRADGLTEAHPAIRQAALGTPAPTWETVTPPDPGRHRPEPSTTPPPAPGPGIGF